METPPDVPLQQLEIFDNKLFINHRYYFPHVVEVPRKVIEGFGHDRFIDNMEAEEVRCKIFNLPRRIVNPE